MGTFATKRRLKPVKPSGRPFFGVLGNNDWGLNLPRRLLLERLGKTFLLVHIPPSRMGGADFLLHGHTHVPRDETFGTDTRAEPGHPWRPEEGCPAKLGMDELDEKTARFLELDASVIAAGCRMAS